MPIIPAKIREARGDWTLERLAVEMQNAGIKISKQAIEAWEKGFSRPNGPNLDALMRVTGRTASFFFGEENGKQSRRKEKAGA